MVGGDTNLIQADHALRAINAIENVGNEESGGCAFGVGDEEDIFGTGEELLKSGGRDGCGSGLLQVVDGTGGEELSRRVRGGERSWAGHYMRGWRAV